MTEDKINKIKKRADEYATSCFPYEEQFLEREAVVKCCVYVVTETIDELEKENAELKAVERMALYSKMSDQIAKAKKIIKTLAGDLSMYSGNYQKELIEAKQFLKELDK